LTRVNHGADFEMYGNYLQGLSYDILPVQDQASENCKSCMNDILLGPKLENTGF